MDNTKGAPIRAGGDSAGRRDMSQPPKGVHVAGAEVEFDAQTRRELLDRLREIEMAQITRLWPQ